MLRFQYEAETLSVRRVCFDEELEISNTYEEPRRTKMLLNDADVVNLEQCIQRLIAYSAAKIKLLELFGVRYNNTNALTQRI